MGEDTYVNEWITAFDHCDGRVHAEDNWDWVTTTLTEDEIPHITYPSVEIALDGEMTFNGETVASIEEVVKLLLKDDHDDDLAKFDAAMKGV